MFKRVLNVLCVASLLVGLAAAVPGCRHSFESRGEITPTLPAWSATQPQPAPAPLPPKE